MVKQVNHLRRQVKKAKTLRDQFVSKQPVLDEVVRIRQQRLAEVMVQNSEVDD